MDVIQLNICEPAHNSAYMACLSETKMCILIWIVKLFALVWFCKIKPFKSSYRAASSSYKFNVATWQKVSSTMKHNAACECYNSCYKSQQQNSSAPSICRILWQITAKGTWLLSTETLKGVVTQNCLLCLSLSPAEDIDFKHFI